MGPRNKKKEIGIGKCKIQSQSFFWISRKNRHICVSVDINNLDTHVDSNLYSVILVVLRSIQLIEVFYNLL